MLTFWVYILRCSDEAYYTGHTDNLEYRVSRISGAMEATGPGADGP